MGADAEKACMKMRSLCAAMGTDAAMDGPVLKIDLHPPE
jgi:hypothetical protein